jgi:CO dehydrogenase nickel-insertion accessory protein CooC1
MISATLSRALARRGHRVLAADLDTNPGLAFSLGIPHMGGGLPAEAVEEHGGAAYGWRLRSGLSPAEVVQRFTVEAPDGPRFLPLGKISDTDKTAPKHTLVALLEVLLGFADPRWDVVGDLEAGPTTPFERYHAFADKVVVVVGPAWRSAMTARRLLPLVADVPTVIVANRFGGEPDHPGLSPAVRIPFDAAAGEAERAGLAPLDCCPDSPAMAAITTLADHLTSPTHQEVLT